MAYFEKRRHNTDRTRPCYLFKLSVLILCICGTPFLHKYSFIEWYFPPNTKFPDPLDQIGLIVTAASLVVSTDLSKYLAPLVVAGQSYANWCMGWFSE